MQRDHLSQNSYRPLHAPPLTTFPAAISPQAQTPYSPAVELQDLPFPSRLHSFQAFFLQPVSLANTSMPFSIHLQSASLCWATPKPGGCFYQAPPTFHAIRLSLSYPNLSEHRDKVCPPKL